ncbi:UNVERIFIED_CONTAM: hypothetical protein B566_EDAN018493, partial [Ephemera danica]
MKTAAALLMLDGATLKDADVIAEVSGPGVPGQTGLDLLDEVEGEACGSPRRVEENKGQNVPPGFTMEEFWAKLSDASKVLSHETTKVSVAFSKPPTPSIQETQQLAQ